MSTWVTHTGVVTMIAVVVLYSLRIGVGVLRGTAISWDAELTHLGMGLAMAGMFDRTFALVPPQVWLAFFGGAGAWFSLRGSLAARRQLSGQLLGGTLVHVGGCAAMAYMLVVVPPSGNMANMADLICGARMIGMQATGSGSVVTPWTGPAIAIRSSCCLAPLSPRCRAFGRVKVVRRSNLDPPERSAFFTPFDRLGSS